VFVFTFFYAFRLAYLKAKELAFGTAEHRPFLVEWVSRNFKKFSSVLLIMGAIYYAFKVSSPEVANMEQRFIGNLLFIFPFVIALCNFVYIYCCSVFLRGYYVSNIAKHFVKNMATQKKNGTGRNIKIRESLNHMNFTVCG